MEDTSGAAYHNDCASRGALLAIRRHFYSTISRFSGVVVYMVPEVVIPLLRLPARAQFVALLVRSND